MLPNMQQKDRSGVLTSLWSINPHKNKWTLMAKVYSFLRTELGKDSVLLPSFLEHACGVLRIPPLDSYLQQQGFALLENETGSLSLVHQTKTCTSNATASSGKGENNIDHGGHSRETGTALTENPGFVDFKNRNQQSIATAASALHESDQQGVSGAAGGDEEAAAGLYAEHELLQAVFDRGFQIDPETLKPDETAEDQKKELVQKLHSMAYEMLIGGEFPVIPGSNGFSHTIKHNPIAAAAQLFSRENPLAFDVLVVDKNDRVKNHVYCEVNPDGTDRAVVLETSGQRTSHVHSTAGPFHHHHHHHNNNNNNTSTPSPSADADVAENATPTYTQKMAYQSLHTGGRFYIFTSQPSTLGNSIISSSNGRHGDSGSPSPPASVDGHGSTSCTTSPPADIEADSAHGEEEDQAANRMHDHHHDRNEMDWTCSYAPRRLSVGCASDAETIVTAAQPAMGAGLDWESGALGDPVAGPGSSPNQYRHSGPHARRADTNTAGVQGRARVQKSTKTTKAIKSSTTRSRGRLSQDLDYLVGALAQDPAELQAQLAHGQRPPVFDHIYRAQLAAQAAQVDQPADPDADDGEDPMMPPMHMTESMQPLAPMPIGGTSSAAAAAAQGLLNYSFPAAMMPSMHDMPPAGNAAASFFSMQSPYSGALLDLSDPAMLDQFLGLPNESTEAVDMSGFSWARS